MITTKIKNKILTITSVFETSSLFPRYDVLVVLHDGPGGTPQITYGRHQVTEHSNLKELLEMYCNSGGRYAKEFKPFVSLISVKPLSDNDAFKYLLKMAGTDIVMHQVQDAFFDRYYWDPAFRFFELYGFTLPLSMAVIYDSYIHSGGLPSWLRATYKEVPPAAGGDEKSFITAYVKARDYWLENHQNKILRNTDYRTDCWLECIEKKNWDLALPVVCRFNKKDSKEWITIP